MRKNIIKPIIASALASVCFLLSGCASLKREYTLIDGEKIEFASDYETEKWRAPLEKLLSNTVGMQFEDDATGELIGKEPPYPERPSIEKGYGCALFDLNFDGTPELLVNMGGGSAGNASYEVYDIYTGENIASLDSSPGNSICCYYNSEKREVNVVNKYSWRGGWSTKLFFTTVITPVSGGFNEAFYLESRYEMELENIAEEDYSIVCKKMDCYVWGERVAPESYLYECDYFGETYIRIKETEIEYVGWHSIEEDGDTPDALGAKMADALLSTGQMFIVYGA